MKVARIFIILIVVLCLFGCSKKMINDDKSVSDSNLLSTGEKKFDSKTDLGEKLLNESTEKSVSYHYATSMSDALAIAKPTKTDFNEKTTSIWTSASIPESLFSYKKRGDMLYIDDSKFPEGARECEGLPLIQRVLPKGISVKRINSSFTYDEKNWMIVLSKGLFAYKMAGGEVAIMTAPQNAEVSSNEKYGVPQKSDWLKVQLEGFDKNNQLIFRTDYKNFWWANAYVKSDIQNFDEITVKYKLTFKTEEMADLYVMEIKKNGFKKVASEQALIANSYSKDGKNVLCSF